MVIQCKNLISLYILPNQRRVNLLVLYKYCFSFISCHIPMRYFYHLRYGFNRLCSFTHYYEILPFVLLSN